MIRRALLLIALLLTAHVTHADEPPALSFPVLCELGETCFLQQFMDRDPGPGARDFTCGPQAYDGHSGTDIRLADLEAMQDGVTVIAAAPGQVRGIRDGVPDEGVAAMPDGQDCGNGVAIAHADGWETQYCHLRQGSVLVSVGDTVEAGTPLGEIGFSGRTEFPHVHITLRDNGAEVDPFDPSDTATCGTGAEPLWAETVPVSGGDIMAIGFADRIPEFDAIKAGGADAESLSAQGAALVLWGLAHSTRAGDEMRLRITNADGAAVFTQTIPLDRTQAQMFRAGGRRTPAGGWTRGTYTGEVTLIRDGAVHDQRQTTIRVD